MVLLGPRCSLPKSTKAVAKCSAVTEQLEIKNKEFGLLMQESVWSRSWDGCDESFHGGIKCHSTRKSGLTMLGNIGFCKTDSVVDIILNAETC